ncbi:MAG: hypothetical protein EBR02_01535, partial [Alphaproteobacteria bacterium]|nr:hypothetical protein [Alphaproteobacteria bacterium]
LIPKHASGIGNFMPALTVIPMFFWGTFEHREMPLWFVFALGIVMDSVMGQPLGLTSLLNIFFMLILFAQRKYIHKEGFVIRWGYFAMFLGGYQLLAWLVLSLWAAQMLPLGAAFLQWLLTLCIYPIFHKAFEVLSLHIHHRRWQIIHGM